MGGQVFQVFNEKKAKSGSSGAPGGGPMKKGRPLRCRAVSRRPSSAVDGSGTSSNINNNNNNNTTERQREKQNKTTSCQRQQKKRLPAADPARNPIRRHGHPARSVPVPVPGLEPT